MAIQKNLVVYACDGCGETALVRPPEIYPGFTGTLVDGSCGLNFKYHACKESCLHPARSAAHAAARQAFKK